MSSGPAIWNIVPLKPNDPQAQGLNQAYAYGGDDRQLPDLQAGFRQSNSDKIQGAPPSFLYTVSAQRWQTVDRKDPLKYTYLQGDEQYNEGKVQILGLPTAMRAQRTQQDGFPVAQQPNEEPIMYQNPFAPWLITYPFANGGGAGGAPLDMQGGYGGGGGGGGGGPPPGGGGGGGGGGGSGQGPMPPPGFGGRYSSTGRGNEFPPGRGGRAGGGGRRPPARRGQPNSFDFGGDSPDAGGGAGRLREGNGYPPSPVGSNPSTPNSGSSTPDGRGGGGPPKPPESGAGRIPLVISGGPVFLQQPELPILQEDAKQEDEEFDQNENGNGGPGPDDAPPPSQELEIQHRQMNWVDNFQIMEDEPERVAAARQQDEAPLVVIIDQVVANFGVVQRIMDEEKLARQASSREQDDQENPNSERKQESTIEGVVATRQGELLPFDNIGSQGTQQMLQTALAQGGTIVFNDKGIVLPGNSSREAILKTLTGIIDAEMGKKNAFPEFVNLLTERVYDFAQRNGGISLLEFRAQAAAISTDIQQRYLSFGSDNPDEFKAILGLSRDLDAANEDYYTRFRSNSNFDAAVLNEYFERIIQGKASLMVMLSKVIAKRGTMDKSMLLHYLAEAKLIPDGAEYFKFMRYSTPEDALERATEFYCAQMNSERIRLNDRVTEINVGREFQAERIERQALVRQATISQPALVAQQQADLGLEAAAPTREETLSRAIVIHDLAMQPTEEEKAASVPAPVPMVVDTTATATYQVNALQQQLNDASARVVTPTSFSAAAAAAPVVSNDVAMLGAEADNEEQSDVTSKLGKRNPADADIVLAPNPKNTKGKAAIEGEEAADREDFQIETENASLLAEAEVDSQRRARAEDAYQRNALANQIQPTEQERVAVSAPAAVAKKSRAEDYAKLQTSRDKALTASKAKGIMGKVISTIRTVSKSNGFKPKAESTDVQPSTTFGAVSPASSYSSFSITNNQPSKRGYIAGDANSEDRFHLALWSSEDEFNEQVEEKADINEVDLYLDNKKLDFISAGDDFADIFSGKPNNGFKAGSYQQKQQLELDKHSKMKNLNLGPLLTGTKKNNKKKKETAKKPQDDSKKPEKKPDSKKK